jgi:hypothetical protein
MAEAMRLIQVELPDNRQGGFVNSIWFIKLYQIYEPTHCSISSAQQITMVLALQALKNCLKELVRITG